MAFGTVMQTTCKISLPDGMANYIQYWLDVFRVFVGHVFAVSFNLLIKLSVQ